MLDTQNFLQNHIENAKSSKFLLQSPFYTSKGSTCKVLAFYDFWFKFYDKFCSLYPTSLAYFITKIGNHDLKLAYLQEFLLDLSGWGVKI